MSSGFLSQLFLSLQKEVYEFFTIEEYSAPSLHLHLLSSRHFSPAHPSTRSSLSSHSLFLSLLLPLPASPFLLPSSILSCSIYLSQIRSKMRFLVTQKSAFPDDAKFMFLLSRIANELQLHTQAMNSKAKQTAKKTLNQMMTKNYFARRTNE